MTTNELEADRQWAREQIQKYQSVYPRYLQSAQTLQQVLEKAARPISPLIIVQTRPKSIPSFAEKAIRKKNKYRDPLNRMTDLCGGRIITQTQAEIQPVCDFIETHFNIDRENSVDVSQRLQPSEFGYRSVHYVIQFKPNVFPTKGVAVEIPKETYPEEGCPMKAEVQVRTMLEHAWAAFTHDRAYKSAFAIPAKWQRELAVLAGMLEAVDQSFSRIQSGLQTYTATYGAYLSEEQLKSEIEILEAVIGCDPQNVELVHRLGKLLMTLGDWQRAIALFSKYVESAYPPLLRDLGIALCKVSARDPQSAEYRQGQMYLEAACLPPDHDADALASLAGTWKALDEEKARNLYRQAFEADPNDPYAISNYLVYEIAHQRDLSAASLMRPTIEAAMRRCRDQADVGMNLPWAFYNLGIFYLLLDRPYDSLAAYAKALQLSTTDWMTETSLRLLDRLAVVREALKGYEWIHRFLLVGRAAKFPNPAALAQVKALASTQAWPASGPYVIVAGGTDEGIEMQTQRYRPLLIEAVRGFCGTIISGGTTAGISGLVGEMKAACPDTLQTIGYVPKLVPAGVMIDRRYSQIRYTEGNDFSALEPLQSWIDLLALGINPSQVKLLGVGGGTIAASEYRIALALGAEVAILEGSGREAAGLFQDENWKTATRLLSLPSDQMTVTAWIGPGCPKLDPKVRETIAQAIHAAYRDDQIHNKSIQDPSLMEWDKLSNDLKESNRLQADHILEKLRQINCTLHPAEANNISPFAFTNAEVEILAEMEHGRWVIERLEAGWKWAVKRDVAKKTSPHLIAWSQLTDEVREWDRDTVRKIPDFLKTIGMKIHRA